MGRQEATWTSTFGFWHHHGRRESPLCLHILHLRFQNRSIHGMGLPQGWEAAGMPQAFYLSCTGGSGLQGGEGCHRPFTTWKPQFFSQYLQLHFCEAFVLKCVHSSMSSLFPNPGSSWSKNLHFYLPSDVRVSKALGHLNRTSDPEYPCRDSGVFAVSTCLPAVPIPFSLGLLFTVLGRAFETSQALF